MDFERKPGSRDSKPKKGTRRSPNRLREKEAEVLAVIVDAHGEYKEEKLGSLNKNKRWEQLGDDVKIYEHGNDSEAGKDRKEFRKQLQLAEEAQEKAREEAGETNQASGKAKSAKAKRRERMQREQLEKSASAPQGYIAVTKSANLKQMRGDKHACRDGRNVDYCKCSYCVGEVMARGQKRDNLLKDQGL